MMQLFWAELRRTWILYLRYPMDYFSGLLVMLFTFYALILGAQYVGGTTMAQFGDRLDSIILGYWLWNQTIFAFSFTAASLQSEAVAGTLEQIFLSPYGALRVFLLRALASLGLNVGTSTLLLLVMLELTERSLSYPPTLILPLLCALTAAYGLGLALGAMALIFKRINRFMTIFQFAMLPIVGVVFEEMEGTIAQVAKFFPMVPAATILRGQMARGVEPEPIEFVFAMGNGIVYFLVGSLLFAWATRGARQHALLGQF